jgi:SAM-dependent methyltransferase
MTDPDQLQFTEAALRAIRNEAGRLANSLLDAARSAGKSEEQLVMACDSLLADFAKRFGLRWEPRGERRVVWPEGETRRQGSIDRLFDRVVVEFEAPGSLYPTNEASANQRALLQARNYLDGLIREEGWQEKSVAGVVTDGFRFIFCRFSAGQWVQEAPLETNAASGGRFLRLLLTFHRPPLLPESLLRQFGADSDLTAQTVTAFYDALAGSPCPLTLALLRQWQDFFADIAGLSPETLAEKKDLIRFAARIVGKEEPDPVRLLFALYTYSALLTKLLAVVAVTPFFDTEDLDRISNWAVLDDADSLARLKEVESGEFFRRIGIRNFTEGDFFGWYCGEWTPDIARAVRGILEALSEYDPDAVEQAPERVRDLLKRLYHGLFPRAVRHDLGEYYTPDWLAERLLAQLDNDLFGPMPDNPDQRQQQAARVRDRLASTRFLDPACGSGTFLVLILRRLRQWARECGVSERDVLLPAVLENVMGFDLNPLAVISARANFLLTIGDLLDPRNPLVNLPVYLADSIVQPAMSNGDNLFDQESGNYRLPLRGVGEVFEVPGFVADQWRLTVMCAFLRRDVEMGVGRQAFADVCERSMGLSGPQFRRVKKTFGDLYDTVRRLHEEGRNGIWADITYNMFMPLFIPKADFVVGNPPWVNWESLPPEYRERSKEIWVKYGLFGHSGFETMLGKGKKDVSTLLTYVAADLYLKPGGRLGFVITQSVFKTAAGQGFRRFQLGNGEKLKVVTVDDFSALQPFEGATNRTAAFVLQKGQPTVYPVPYYVWRKKGRDSVPFSAHLKEAQPLLDAVRQAAEPVEAADPTSSWLNAPRPALQGMRKVLGASDYRAHAGAYSGGANAVYWLQITRRNPDGTVEAGNITEGAKREIQAGIHTLEPDLLYPLLRGREVKKWAARPDPSARFLIVQDRQTRRGIPEEELQKRCPRTLAYLKGYEDILKQRKSQAVRNLMEVTFYSMFSVGEHTFADYKVVWAEQGAFGCAVVGEQNQMPVIPDHKVMLIPFDTEEEAHYVCAVANSSPFLLAVNAYAIAIQQDPHVFENARVPRFAPGNPIHRRLAELSREAHRIASGQALMESLAAVEQEIDACAAQVWGLTAEELEAAQAALRE